jgi:pseudaminic acid synthase
MSTAGMTIADHRIGPDHPVYVVAELSANHSQDYGRAEELVRAAAEAGADAVKLQTYTPDTMTIDCDAEEFRIKGTIWEGRTLYELYQEAHTPWEWQPRLMDLATSLGISLFSTPFDATAVDFLEEMGVPAYKVASFEIVDLPLIAKMAATGKPIIMSIGMATREEIGQAVNVARESGANEIALLRCTSAYPARPEEADLRTIPDLAESFSAVPGLSDHNLDIVVPITAVALGARIVEKHLTLSRRDPSPDSSFSLEPKEFEEMVEAIRTTEKALGAVRYGPRESERPSRVFRRSLFVVEDIKRGEPFSHQNVRSIRPGHGLPPSMLDHVIGKMAARDLARGTPLRKKDIDHG